MGHTTFHQLLWNHRIEQTESGSKKLNQCVEPTSNEHGSGPAPFLKDLVSIQEVRDVLGLVLMSGSREDSYLGAHRVETLPFHVHLSKKKHSFTC
jgi:hypothetical protein